MIQIQIKNEFRIDETINPFFSFNTSLHINDRKIAFLIMIFILHELMTIDQIQYQNKPNTNVARLFSSQ